MTFKKMSKPILFWILFACLLGLSHNLSAQCAGTDNTVTVCNKDQDPGTQNFDLFSNLGGSPAPGGTWSTTDPANFFALDQVNGIVNLWEVKNSGVHEFTYTNPDCNESAVVTINLGGYPGEDNVDGSADACGDDPAVNLHSFIGDDTQGKIQDFNGLWEAVTPSAVGHLSGNIFNAQAAGVGVYEFTHTVPEVDTCPSRQVRLILEVQRPANSGVGTELIVCTTDDLSGLTNFDLDGLLAGEDMNGTWSEGPNTDQLEDLTDHEIDVQAIRDQNTMGTFSFTYTVFPAHAVCSVERTTVNIVILPTFQATMEAVNYCNGSSEYTVNIADYDDTLIQSGTYDISYALTSGGITRESTSTLVLGNDGTGSFNIDADLTNLNEVTVLNITSLGEEVCPDIQVDPISFIVSDPMADVIDTCEGEDITVSLTNIFDASFDRTNGDYDVTYTILAPSGTTNTFTMNAVAFDSGNAALTLPADQISETGNHTIGFEVANGLTLDCVITDTVTLTPIPSAIDLDLVVDNSCDATRIDVMVDAPLLADGGYVVSYEVISQETNAVLIDNTINFAGGMADYQIDLATLPQGNYTVTVGSTQNDTTPCRIDFDFELSENFAVEGIPQSPTAEALQTFCLGMFAPNTPILADIEVSANGQLLFYATATDMDILPLDTPLVDGEDYFISSMDPDNNCEGSDRIQVVVTLSDLEPPTVVGMNPTFCGSENPMITDLNTSVNSTGDIVWFETALGGTPMEGTTLLIDNKSYFAATSNGQCYSVGRVEVVPTIYHLEPAIAEYPTLALCGLDQPTVANLVGAIEDTPYNIVWYDAPENGTPLADTDLLVDGMVYFAESFDPDTGCTNPERAMVTVDLSHCDPKDYGFFVPDGFSPNGDGRNDTFFVPNIEVIFPNFTLEILNRYGTTLFKGDKSTPAWDGRNRSGMAPNGVYFYIIDYHKEGYEPIQGRLYLNR